MFPMIDPYSPNPLNQLFVEKTNDEISQAASVRAPEVRASAESRLAVIRDTLQRERAQQPLSPEKVVEILARAQRGRHASVLAGRHLADDVKRAFAEARMITSERLAASTLEFIATHVRGSTVQRLPLSVAMGLFETYKPPQAGEDPDDDLVGIGGGVPFAGMGPRGVPDGAQSLGDVVSSLGVMDSVT